MNAANFGLFTLLCAIMIVATLLLLVWPLLRGRSQTSDIRQARYALHKRILAELDDDLRDGRLSSGDHQTARQEAEARLLNEIGSADSVAEQQIDLPAKKLAIILLVLIPLAAGGLYVQLGTPTALDPMTRQRPDVGPNEIAGMVKKLEARMALEPNDTKGWLMLARSYRAQARYAEAITAYEKAWPELQKDAGELARFAGVIAIEKTSFAGRPTELLVKSLSINASEPDALMLAGSAAVERGDIAAAVEWWNKLLALLEPGSEDEVWLKEEIRVIKERKTAAAASAVTHP
ncbi:c-type cytochrome biogenesis protein CcmI [Deefgea tanakiae]|uniref:C-type cytochrome biogenesis protein CcmI n=1 Tax=Deefgea tanakiae TaxID=2865840 RepID=A0ABX8Z3T8_9NEIS|nr:c-type cytochrome biogenesis protein CcmI [Deefgea tanakiae]QZA77241.1 c-type cytochrome biogenesis protein CcmI [Deefgea tanakiae]